MAGAEANLRASIVKKLSAYSGFWLVTHADQFGTGGLPDIIGCVHGTFIGLEVKMPGKEHTLTKRQAHRLGQITKAGGKAAMVTSVSQAFDFVFGSI
jgi:hypothetical protein